MGVNDFKTIRWEDERLLLLDQRLLPNAKEYIEIESLEMLYDAIRTLAVRGAPAIGVAASYGMAVVARAEMRNRGSLDRLPELGDYLISARPTAVNLPYAVKRQLALFENLRQVRVSDNAIVDALIEYAQEFHKAEEDACYRMAEYGLSLLKPDMGILTHCNAGGLATTGYGTALGPLHLGQERGYGFHVYADETRPLLQGARLTAWELVESGVDVTVICDNMASLVMKEGRIDAIVTGCDRMARNGDGANKIGTSGLAILAKEYGIPFYMFIPTSTIDMDTKTGEDIVIEERDGAEIRSMWYEKPMAPAEAKFYNPAFDVTDHEYITAVVTERGVAGPPYTESLAQIMASPEAERREKENA